MDEFLRPVVYFHAVRLFAENNPTLKGVHIKTASEFTSTVGFGSSSASTVTDHLAL
jgi:homoserine kinase